LSNFRGSSSSLYRRKRVASARARDANARWSFFRRDRFHQRNTSSFLPSHRRLDSRVTPSGASTRLHEEADSRVFRARQHDSNLFIALANRRSLTALDWWYQSGSPLRTTQHDDGDKLAI